MVVALNRLSSQGALRSSPHDGGRRVTRLRVKVSPGCRSHATVGPVLLDSPGVRITAGRAGRLRLPHVSGTDNEFLSGCATAVGLDQTGRAYLVNLSQSHELVVRPWGLGTSAEASIPPRQGAAPLQPRFLERGAYWVRNGRHWDAHHARFGTPLGDDRSSWALIQVEVHDPLATLLPPIAAAEDTARKGATVQVLVAPAEWDLSEFQIRSVLVFYSEFLSWPPRVAPRLLTEPAAERAVQGTGGLSRLDHLVSSAKRRGFTGDRTDLLAWLVAFHHITPAMVGHATRDPALAGLLFPVMAYRPSG